MESLQELLLALIIVAFATTSHLIQAQPDPKGTHSFKHFPPYKS